MMFIDILIAKFFRPTVSYIPLEMGYMRRAMDDFEVLSLHFIVLRNVMSCDIFTGHA
jgi:hypothetical protein